MQAWNITQHAYAISAYCDDVEDTIAADEFDCGEGEVSSLQADRVAGDS